VTIYAATADPQRSVNRQWTAALGAIECDEPSLTATATSLQIEVALVNNPKGCIILGFGELAIL